MVRLGKSVVDALPHPKVGQAFYRDTGLKGFGVRVGAKSKAYYAETKIDGKTVRVTIGQHGAFTAEQAKAEAKHLLGQMARGINPNDTRKEARVKGVTLAQSFDDYLEARKSLKPTTVRDYRKCMRMYFSDWRNKPLVEITKDMVERRHKKIGERSQAQANLGMRFLRALFNFATERYEDSKGRSLIPENPVKRLSKTRAWYRIERRTDYLKPNEIKPWYEAVIKIENAVIQDYLLLLLFTGLRRQEGARLTWSNADLLGRTLTVHDPKNREPHALPLSDFLHDLLQKRKREAVDSPYVFPADSASGHLVEPRKQWERVMRESGIRFTLHGLRRTFATAVNSLERSLSAYSIKRLLGHKIRDITGEYIQHDIECLRAPMQQVTDYLLKYAGVKDSAPMIELGTNTV